MNKKSLALFVCLVMIAAIFTGCAAKDTTTSGAAGSDVIKIGAVFPMTGDVATFGESSKKALELLKEEYNAKGGLLGKQIQVIYENS